MKVYIKLVPVMEYPPTGAPYEAYKRVSIVSVDTQPASYDIVLSVLDLNTEERYQAYAVVKYLVNLGVLETKGHYLVLSDKTKNI